MVPKIALSAAAMLAALVVVQPAAAQPPYRNAGSERKFLPFDVLKPIVDRAVGGRLIGSDLDPASATYEMRYMRGTQIVDVVVDAYTGRILGRRESM